MLEVKGSRLLLEIDDLRGVAMRRWAPLIRSSRELAQFIFFFFPNLLALVPFELLTGHDRCRDTKKEGAPRWCARDPSSIGPDRWFDLSHPTESSKNHFFFLFNSRLDGRRYSKTHDGHLTFYFLLLKIYYRESATRGVLLFFLSTGRPCHRLA